MGMSVCHLETVSPSFDSCGPIVSHIIHLSKEHLFCFSSLMKADFTPGCSFMEMIAEAAIQEVKIHLLIRRNLGFSILLKNASVSSWGSQGIKPTTLWLLGDPLSVLSHNRPCWQSTQVMWKSGSHVQPTVQLLIVKAYNQIPLVIPFRIVDNPCSFNWEMYALHAIFTNCLCPTLSLLCHFMLLLSPSAESLHHGSHSPVQGSGKSPPFYIPCLQTVLQWSQRLCLVPLWCPAVLTWRWLSHFWPKPHLPLSHRGEVLSCFVFLSRELPVLFRKSNLPIISGFTCPSSCVPGLTSSLIPCFHLFPSPSWVK